MLNAHLLLSVALTGAVPGARPPSPGVGAVKVGGRSYISAPVLIRRRALRMVVNERAGIYTLLDGGHRMVLVPGFHVAEVDGQTVELDYPAMFHRGELLVSPKLFSYAQRSFRDPAAKDIPLRSVILDPGHGGRDSGALGRRGLCEKDVALSVALRLKGLLEARGVQVDITRSRDVFIPLLERSRVANRSGADLFLSIHCNACRSRSVRGLETFALSPGISDGYRARKAAAHHRPSDLVDGAADRVGLTAERTIFRAHMGEQRRRSLTLARSLQAEMVRLLGEPDRGVKLRNFSVLRETYIPAALVEVGFISNSTTEKKMRTSAYRQRIAEALAGGVARYARGESHRLEYIAGRKTPAPATRYASRRPAAQPARSAARTARSRVARTASRTSYPRTLSASARHRVAYDSR